MTHLTFQDVIAWLLAVAAAAFVIRFIWRSLEGRSGCACGPGKAGCSMKSTPNAAPTLGKRIPLVTVTPIRSPTPSSSTKNPAAAAFASKPTHG
jgi:hypothetical protein